MGKSVEILHLDSVLAHPRCETKQHLMVFVWVTKVSLTLLSKISTVSFPCKRGERRLLRSGVVSMMNN